MSYPIHLSQSIASLTAGREFVPQQGQHDVLGGQGSCLTLHFRLTYCAAFDQSPLVQLGWEGAGGPV